MAITDIIEESEMIHTGAPSIKYEGERPLKKQEMLMAGPDWYIKRMELLMDEYGYDYDEAGEIAYDSDKYYEVIGIDPGGIGDESRIMDEEVVEEGIMRAANGGVAMQGGGLNYNPSKMVSVPTEFKARKNSPNTELAYITDDEAGILKALKPGTPHKGPEGIPNYDSFDISGGYTSGRDIDDSTGQAKKGSESQTFSGNEQTKQQNLANLKAAETKTKKDVEQWQKEARDTRRKMDDLKKQDALDRNDPWVSTGTGKARFSTLSPAQKAAFLKEQEEQRAKGNYYNYNLDAEGNILGWQPDMGLKDIEVNTGDQPHSDLMETEEFWTVDEKGNPVKKTRTKSPTDPRVLEKDDWASGAMWESFYKDPYSKQSIPFGVGAVAESLFLDKGAERSRRFFADPNFKSIFGNPKKSVLQAGKYRPLNMPNPYTMDNLPRTKSDLDDIYKQYMKDRMAGHIDAYGNTHPNFRRDKIRHTDKYGNVTFKEVFMPSGLDDGPDEPEWRRLGYSSQDEYENRGGGSGGGGGGSDDSDEDDWEMPLAFRAEGGRVGRAYGGIMDKYTGRRAYGLGSIFKKAKKIFKSPLGKAALLGLGGWGLSKLGAGGLGLMGKMQKAGGFGKWLSGISTGKIAAGIGGISLATALLSPPVDEDGDGYDDKTGFSVEEWRKKGAQGSQDVPLAFRADGGDAESGLMNLGGMEKDYRADGGFVPIGKKERADDVPARLSKNEFVFTADAVRNAGGGDVDKGAEVMYNVMKNLEAGGDVSEETQGLDGARQMFQTSQRLEEVL